MSAADFVADCSMLQQWFNSSMLYLLDQDKKVGTPLGALEGESNHE